MPAAEEIYKFQEDRFSETETSVKKKYVFVLNRAARAEFRENQLMRREVRQGMPVKMHRQQPLRHPMQRRNHEQVIRVMVILEK